MFLRVRVDFIVILNKLILELSEIIFLYMQNLTVSVPAI